MFKKSLEEVESFISGDKILIKEVLHPKNESIDIPYSIAQGTIEVGKSSLPHILKGAEVYYILKGEGELHIDEEFSIVKEGDTVFVPPYAKQHVKNIGDELLKFLCIVSPPWSADDEAIL